MTSASFRGLAALAAALMLTGCATEPESPELFFWVKPGVCAALPDSPCGADMTENAILTAVRDGRTERLLTVRACRGGLMSLDVMTLTGMALMSVTYDGTMLVSTNYVPLPKELRAEQIVADILMGQVRAGRAGWLFLRRMTLAGAVPKASPSCSSRRSSDDDGKHFCRWRLKNRHLVTPCFLRPCRWTFFILDGQP